LFSGNSPISLIVAGVLSIAGAYLGGAKINNQWDPAFWNWEHPSVYLAMFEDLC
jgi:hypothetical protein